MRRDVGTPPNASWRAWDGRGCDDPKRMGVLSLSGNNGHGAIFGAQRSVANDPGCVKTLRGITVPGILGLWSCGEQKNIKICLPLGMTTKSDFVFAQPRPKAGLHRLRQWMPQRLVQGEIAERSFFRKPGLAQAFGY